MPLNQPKQSGVMVEYRFNWQLQIIKWQVMGERPLLPPWDLDGFPFQAQRKDS